jgi:hypothetical protein
MERSRKQNEDRVKGMQIEDGIENVRRGRGISITQLQNVEANVESLRSLDVAGGTLAEGTGRSRMSSARGDTGEEGGKDTNHLTPQILIVIEKDYIDHISRTEARLRARNELINCRE